MNTLRLENINLHAPYFLAIISRKDNPMLSVVLEEFNETVSFLFDPQEESLTERNLDSDGSQ